MRPAFLLSALVLCAGCGSTPLPEPQNSQSRAAIRAAAETNAGQYPSASLYLKMATDEIKRAEALIADDEEEGALRALQRAEIDAELALDLARAEKAREEARQALARVQELRSEGMQE
jgi:hypothetical protein